MYIHALNVAGIPPISERITLEFDERVNVFIGPNASGKSTILNWINAELQSGITELSDADNWDIVDIENGLLVSGAWVEAEYAPDRGPDYEREYDSEDGPPPVVVVGPTRKGLPNPDELDIEQSQGKTSRDILGGPFCGLRVKMAIDILAEAAWDRPPVAEMCGIGTVDTYPARENFLKAVELAYSCTKHICKEIITGPVLQNYVTNRDTRGDLASIFGATSSINILRGLGVVTNDVPNLDDVMQNETRSYPAHFGDAHSVPIYVGDLSSGTEGTFLWIMFLTLNMLNHYGFQDGWDKMPAVLLIDEIENHLHPTWQRRVIPALLKHFPGLQIFATTHSPFVVAGLEKGQVHLLNRDEKGVITATTNTEDIVGWTADEILRTYMGVDDPTDDDTASAAAELRKLRDEGTREDAQAEKERQDRMRELRAAVDTNVLSGPRVAEDERFAATLESILERYRQSTDLNQENG